MNAILSVQVPILVTARAAATLLSISPRKIWGLTASGELPVVRIGRAVRYAVDDLRAFADRHKSGAS
jgi:excisionase family DNA binding protein